MNSYPIRLPDFVLRDPQDPSDSKLLENVRLHGWHVSMILEDETGPPFAFTVGIYLRTLQPEILIMGLNLDTSHRILNTIGEHLLEGGEIVEGKRYPDFVSGFDVMFRKVAPRHYHDYLGSANWFYRHQPEGFPVFQCVWPDEQGLFPQELGYRIRFASKQMDLSI